MSPELRGAVVLQRLATMRQLLDVLAEEDGITGADLRGDLRRRLVVERALSALVELPRPSTRRRRTSACTSGPSPSGSTAVEVAAALLAVSA